MQSIVTDRVAWPVCQSVCHTSEPCKNRRTDRDTIWDEVSGGPRETCIRWGSRSPMGRGNFEGEGASHCKVKGHVHLQHFLATRHRASTSMYSLTFRVRVAIPAQYGRNGTASLQITSRTQQARRILSLVRACVVCAACDGPGRLPLGSATHFHNVAIATQTVHRLQIRPIEHN